MMFFGIERGCHLVTDEVLDARPLDCRFTGQQDDAVTLREFLQSADFKIGGLCNFFSNLLL